MNLQEKLQAEADQRAANIAKRFSTDQCVSCGTAGARELIRLSFRWRKQVSRSDRDATRVEHTSELPLCSSCWSELSARRRFWRPFRLAYGIILGGAFCGVIGCSAVLWFMRLNPQERAEDISVLIASVLLIPVALLLSRFERGLSVPARMLDLTGRGWECWDVHPI